MLNYLTSYLTSCVTKYVTSFLSKEPGCIVVVDGAKMAARLDLNFRDEVIE